VVPCCSAVSGSRSSSADSARGCWEQASWGSCWRSDRLPHNDNSCCSQGCEAHWVSLACQSESSGGSAGRQGVESAALDAETAEECVGTADTAVAGTDTAADHSLCNARVFISK
jgi:hypothetical protein